MASNNLKSIITNEAVQIFWKLSAGTSEEREKASQILLNMLDLHTVRPKSLDDFASSEEQSSTAEPKEMLQYSLERLFKGLAGLRPESKHGFSLALTLLLEKLHKSQIRSGFETAEKCLINMKVDSKMEASSKKIGTCLLLLAFTGSGSFVKLRSDQRNRLLDAVTPMLEGADRSLADLAACVIAGAVEQLSTEEFNSHLFAKLSAKLSSGWDKLDINGLLLLLSCHQHQKETVSRNYIKTHYATKHLISQANFTHFERICLSSVSDYNDAQTSCRLHPATELLLSSLMSKSPSLLTQLGSDIVNCTLTDPELPPSRKALGLSVLAWLADQPAGDFADASKGACLSDCLAKPEACAQLRSHAVSRHSLLHPFARQLLSNRLLNSSTDEGEQAAVVAVASRFLQADCLFDDGLLAECRVLRADVMARLPAELLDDCAKRIEADLRDASPDAANQQRRRRAAFGVQTLRHLASGSRSLLSSRPRSCARSLLCLADLFLPANDRAAGAAASPAEARSAFSRALDSMSAAALSNGSAYRRGYRRCLRQLASGLVDRLASIEEAGERSAVRQAVSLGLQLLSSASAAAADNDNDDSGVCGGIDWCFALAFLHLGFHLLPGGNGGGVAASGSSGGAAVQAGATLDEAPVDEASAQALIADLNECRRRSGADGDDGESGDGEVEAKLASAQPKWPDVLLDSFVGLLAASRSRLLRSVTSLVARQVASLVTPEGVASLTQLLLEGDEAEAGNDDDKDESADSEDDDEAGDADATCGDKDKDDDKESEISISEPSESGAESDGDGVDPEFRRACKSALGEAACPSDAEADMDPSDLSDSAMERVDQALSLAFRSQLGPSSNGRVGRAAALERRRRRCQSKLRLLDVAEPLLLSGGPRCRASLAACLAQLALLAVGGGGGVGGGSFWSAAPAGERDQLRLRSLALLKRTGAAAAAAAAAADASTKKSTKVDKAIDEEIVRAVEAAIAANLRSPLPARMAETAADILSALLRIRPATVESRLVDALARQLSPSPSSTTRRFRLGGLALWQRVCSERPRLLAGLRQRLLDLLLANGDAGQGDGEAELKSHDRAAIVSLAVCLIKTDGDADNADGEDDSFHRRLAEWTFDRLDGETGPAGVTSAHLLAALLQLGAALLRRSRRRSGQRRSPSAPAVRPGLAERLRALRASSRSRDLRRSLQLCLAELAALAKPDSPSGKRKRSMAPVEELAAAEEQQQQQPPASGKNKRRRISASCHNEEQQMLVD